MTYATQADAIKAALMADPDTEVHVWDLEPEVINRVVPNGVTVRFCLERRKAARVVWHPWAKKVDGWQHCLACGKHEGLRGSR